jgi:hypothetical protein
MIHNVYKCNKDVVMKFMDCAVGSVVGRRVWKKNSDLVPLRLFVTASDEAFAMLVLENNAEKWIDEIENPGRSRKERSLSRYTEGIKESTSPNKWGKEGIQRFLELFESCTLGRLVETEDVSATNGQPLKKVTLFKTVEDLVLEHKRTRSISTNGRHLQKRLRDLNDLQKVNTDAVRRQEEKRRRIDENNNNMMLAMAMGQDLGTRILKNVVESGRMREEMVNNNDWRQEDVVGDEQHEGEQIYNTPV